MNHNEEVPDNLKGLGDMLPADMLKMVNELPRWDGQNHIMAMSVTVQVKGGIDEQMLFGEYLTKWMVGMVAGWVEG